jgi:hypothetical protein
MVMIPNAPRLGDLPKGGEPVPEGTYHLRADKAEYKLSNENKTPMVEVMFTVFGPEPAEVYHGRKVFENFMLAGDGAWRTSQFFEAAGKPSDFVIESDEQFLKLEVAAVVEVEKGKANPKKPGENYPDRAKVKRYMPIE